MAAITHASVPPQEVSVTWETTDKKESPDLVTLDLRALEALSEISAENLAAIQEVVKCLNSKVITPANAADAAQIMALVLVKLGVLRPTDEQAILMKHAQQFVDKPLDNSAYRSVTEYPANYGSLQGVYIAPTTDSTSTW